MVEQPFAFFVMAGEGMLFGVFLFFAYKVFQDHHRISMPVLRTLLAVVLCFIIWVLAITLHPLQLWQRIVAAGSAQYGAFLYYAAVRRMFENVSFRPIIRWKGFWITALVVGSIIVLDIFLKGQPVFDSTDPYISSWPSNIEAVLSYSYLLLWDVLIIKIYLAGLRRNVHLVDQGRFGLSLCAFALNLLGLLLEELNLLLAMLKNVEYRLALNTFYHVSLVVMVLLIVLNYILPDKILVKIVAPLASYKALRQQRQKELLRRLHQTMVNIVPGVQLPCEAPVRDLRILIEISDARQIIWSLEQRLKPVTPQEEARYLLHLMHKKTVLTTPGTHSPPPTSRKNIIKHNVIVAQHLQKRA